MTCFIDGVFKNSRTKPSPIPLLAPVMKTDAGKTIWKAGHGCENNTHQQYTIYYRVRCWYCGMVTQTLQYTNCSHVYFSMYTQAQLKGAKNTVNVRCTTMKQHIMSRWGETTENSRQIRSLIENFRHARDHYSVLSQSSITSPFAPSRCGSWLG